MLANRALFKTAPVEGLPVPAWIAAIMVFSFVLPLLTIPMTTPGLAKHPWLLWVWLASAFSLTVLVVLRRLFTRFAIVLNADRSVLITQPFSRTLIPPTELRSVIATTQHARISEQGTVISYPHSLAVFLRWQ